MKFSSVAKNILNFDTIIQNIEHNPKKYPWKETRSFSYTSSNPTARYKVCD